jgi:iron(III) transport system substrate-binding protein
MVRIGLAAALAAAAMAASAQAAEVNLYTGRHYDTDNQLYEEFTAATGIKVNVIESEADELVERIKAEGANSPADVLITVDAGRLFRAEAAGVLQPVKSETLEANIPANLRHPDGLWFGFTKRVRGIIYAKDRVKPEEITTYEDLADPKWRGRICIRSSTNVYNQSLTASMIEADGLEATGAWAKGLVANMARAPQGGDTDQIKAVAAGECDIAVSNHYYYVRLLKSDKPEDQEVAAAVGIAFPNQGDRGTHANISGGGLVATAPNKDNAIKFLEYLSTPSAQAYFVAGNHEYPVVEGVKLDPTLDSWGPFKTDTINAAKYGEHQAEAVKLMDRAGWQ